MSLSTGPVAMETLCRLREECLKDPENHSLLGVYADALEDSGHPAWQIVRAMSRWPGYRVKCGRLTWYQLMACEDGRHNDLGGWGLGARPVTDPEETGGHPFWTTVQILDRTENSDDYTKSRDVLLRCESDVDEILYGLQTGTFSCTDNKALIVWGRRLENALLEIRRKLEHGFPDVPELVE